jgi:hypothetical protein
LNHSTHAGTFYFFYFLFFKEKYHWVLVFAYKKVTEDFALPACHIAAPPTSPQ